MTTKIVGDGVVIRTLRSWAVGVLIALMAAECLLQLNEPGLENRLVWLALGLGSLLFAIRSVFGGYIKITAAHVVVRTAFRTRIFKTSDIESVTAVEVMQITPRVFPVLYFRDGTKYKLSEFFVQRGTYAKRGEGCIVTDVVARISASLGNGDEAGGT